MFPFKCISIAAAGQLNWFTCSLFVCPEEVWTIMSRDRNYSSGTFFRIKRETYDCTEEELKSQDQCSGYGDNGDTDAETTWCPSGGLREGIGLWVDPFNPINALNYFAAENAFSRHNVTEDRPTDQSDPVTQHSDKTTPQLGCNLDPFTVIANRIQAFPVIREIQRDRDPL